jgi:hypothetical protein
VGQAGVRADGIVIKDGFNILANVSGTRPFRNERIGNLLGLKVEERLLFKKKSRKGQGRVAHDSVKDGMDRRSVVAQKGVRNGGHAVAFTSRCKDWRRNCERQ